MAIVNTLDLTGILAEQRLEVLLAGLDGLAVGASVEVHTGPQWDGLVSLLQEHRWGGFDWQPLVMGPEQWVADMVRLEPRNQGIGLFMSRDHQRCDALFASAENAANDGDLAAMAHFCQRFFVSMAHHFHMEEGVFFPAFENRTGMRQGPTMVMRSEHEQMRNLMGQMQRAAEQQNADLLLKTGETLLFVMQQHNVKEEQMLYPMADAHMGSVVGELLKEMQRS